MYFEILGLHKFLDCTRYISIFYSRYLTGNPCTDYEGYREFVVACLPHLEWLDGKEVSRSERILATQRLPELRKRIAEQQEAYTIKRVRTNVVEWTLSELLKLSLTMRISENGTSVMDGG